jgi:hypothetical protein
MDKSSDTNCKNQTCLKHQCFIIVLAVDSFAVLALTRFYLANVCLGYNLNGLFTLATFVGDNASNSNKCLYLPWLPWVI